MNLAHPHILWLLLVFPPLLMVFFWWAMRERRRLMTQFVEARLMPGLISGISPARRKVRMACLIAAVALLLIALARPQWGFTWEQTKQKGLDIVVAIDTSKSMLAEDIAPDRLARAKLAALDLMQQAKSDRLGLVAFAGSAFLQCPMTVDDNAFRQSVELLDVNVIPQGGTALAEAIRTALAAFKEENNFKVLVLFSDGEDNDEGALEAAQTAAKEGMKIFTIGIGTADGELLRFKDAKGRTDYIRDNQGNVVKSRLNESLLQQIAGVTEGAYYRLAGAKTIDDLYERFLGPLPKSEGQEKLVKRYHERFHWPLAAALVLLLVEMLMLERKRREPSLGAPASLPAGGKDKSSHSPAGMPALPGMLALLGLLVLPLAVSASPSSALKEFGRGNFTNALTEYERLLAAQSKLQKPEDPRLHFNAGAAAYRATNYDSAMRHFTTVLSAQDLRLQARAYYNLGNVFFRRGQLAEDLDQLEESWKEAIKQYEHSLALNKADADAAFNLAFVKKAVEQVKLLREAALRARAAADQEIRRRHYHQALEIMEQLLQQNIAAKPFEEFTQKLKNIDEIANPTQPQSTR